MIPIVHLSSQAEPGALHGIQTANTQVFSAHLSIQILRNNVLDEEDGALDLTHTFLDTLQSGSFHFFDMSPGNGKPAVYLSAIDRLLPKMVMTDPKGVKTWLDNAKIGFLELARETSGNNSAINEVRFYLTQSSDTGDASLHNATAFDLLRSTAKWPAPLAQNTGLMTALKIEWDSAANPDVTIVFTPGSDVPGVQIDVVGDNSNDGMYELSVTYKTDEGTKTIKQRTPKLVPFNELALGRLFRPDGSFLIPGDADMLNRRLTRIEEQAPTLLWPATTLGSMAQDPKVGASLAKVNPDELSDETLLPAAIVHWIARASAVSMFDVMIGGLLLPFHNKADEVNRQSIVLQRLSRRFVGYFELSDPSLELKEDKVYLAIHNALWAHLTSLDTKLLWNTIAEALSEEPNQEESSLEKIRNALKTNTPAGTVSWKNWNDLLSRLSEELGDLALILEGEESAESWILARLDAALLKADGMLIDPIKVELPMTDRLPLLYNEFKADITGPFNAAEATRRDYGSEVMTAILSAVPQSDIMTADERASKLVADIPDFPLFTSRFPDISGPDAGPFNPFYEVAISANRPESSELTKALTDASKSRLNELVAQDPPSKIFRPDATPQPLRIPIADSTDPVTLDAMQGSISGIGFLVQAHRHGEPKPMPVHASLISADGLSIKPSATIDPTLPTFTPGAEGLFQPYTGTPLSSPSRTPPGNSGEPMPPAVKKAREKIVGYTKAEADYKDGLERVPDLAYGVYYGLSGFWLPPSGALPLPLRKNGDAFAPTPPEEAHKANFWPTSTTRYLRRTAIAETLVAGAQPVPAISKDVHPLAIDTVCIALESLDGATRHIDIFRNANGTGILHDEEDLWFEGNDIPAGEHPEGALVLRNVDLGELSLNLLTVSRMATDGTSTIAALHTEDNRFTIPAAPTGETGWIRLSFEATVGIGALVFEDPANDRGQDNVARTTPVTVLAPAKTGWTEDQKRIVTAQAPGVSFTDLERWAANTELWNETSGGNADYPRDLLSWLRTAQALFQAVGDPFADRFNALPDPAVSGILIGLARTDQVLSSAQGPSVGQAFLELNPYHNIDKTAINKTDLLDADTRKELLDELRKDVNSIIDAATVQLTLVGGAEELKVASGDGERKFIISVPKGEIARLWLSPAVRTKHFEKDTGAFDPEMKTLSCGAATDDDGIDYTLFDGAKLFVEVMVDIPDDLEVPDTVLCITAEGTSRGYNVTASPTAMLRLFSEAELITQRWRPSGRPIYSWIDPAPKPHPAGPVVALGSTKPSAKTPRNETPGNIADFEAEAFVGIDENDGEHTRVRLLPAPEPTLLWSFNWPERAATYLRHRLVMRSRYAAAMTTGRTTIQSSRTYNRFAARVAILADLAAAPVTRPQLRAHLPVQRRLDDGSVTAPVICVLNEPPFSQLGLAERLSADLVATNTYRFDSPDTEPHLRLDGLRKEIGPDPRLSYFPVRDKTSLACWIEPEGPVGLHYEGPATDNPAYANCQYMLHLRMADSLDAEERTELEESFAGIALARHADPAWSWITDPERRNQLPPDRAVWLDLEDKPLKLIVPAKIADARKQQTVLEVNPQINDGSMGHVKIARTALYADGGAGFAVLCEGNVHALLFKPLGDNRVRISTFARGNAPDITTKGQDNRHRLLASAVMTLPAHTELDTERDLVTTRQSEATFAEWVKTTRDLSKLLVIENDGEPGLHRTDRLIARADGTTLSLGTDSGAAPVMSPLASRQYPLNVQRHLVHLVRRQAPEIGAPVALFDQALLADGAGVSRPPTLPDADTGNISVVVAEMETRANILLVNNEAAAAKPLSDGHFAQFNSGVFDLAGTRLINDIGALRPTKALRFHIRSANRPLQLAGLSAELTILDVDGNIGKKATFEMFLPMPPPESLEGKSDHSADLVVFAKDGSLHRWTRSPSEPGVQQLIVGINPDDVTFAETIKLTLSDNDDKERWVDVSLLQSAEDFDPDAPDRFEFDWLFASAPSMPRDVLPGALDPTILNKLPEAQARLIGMTDPIPVITKI